MKPGAEADRVYLQHMLECIGRVEEYIGGDEPRGISLRQARPRGRPRKALADGGRPREK